MAFGKTAGCLILAGAAWGAQLTVRHEHLHRGCDGVLTVSAEGVSFAGPKGHQWRWRLEDIQELDLSPQSLHILTYRDSRLRLGTDQGYTFSGAIPAGDLYAVLKDRMDQRLVAEIGEVGEAAGETLRLPVKLLGRIMGSEGTLAFGPEAVVYSSPAKEQSRTWRYRDLEGISSSDRFQLTITTLEKSFHFQLKQPISESGYNQLWLQIERKNGRIQ